MNVPFGQDNHPQLLHGARVTMAATPIHTGGAAGSCRSAYQLSARFRQHCDHRVDDSGQQIRKGLPSIPDFTSLAWQMSQTDLEINHRIVDGNEPLMPAYRDKLSSPQMLALTVYVRAFAVGPQASPVALAPGVPKPGPSPQAPAAQMSSLTAARQAIGGSSKES